MNRGTPGALILTGQVVSLEGDPTREAGCLLHIEQGAIVVEEGKVCWVGDRGSLPTHWRRTAEFHDYGDRLLMPGFIDTHVHYPQVGVMASHGTQLLQWLETYTFPEEARFENFEYARDQARLFLDQLLANGVTTASVYCTIHPASVDAFFGETEKRGLCMVAGKVMMDRNAPDYLLDTAEQGYEESRALIDRWHRKSRMYYAVTPRFAPTSTPGQLEACEALISGYPDIFFQTHLAENSEETQWVRTLFPEAASYFDVYNRYGMLGTRSLFGHAIYLEDNDLARASESDSVFVHCPTSNLFIGSGLFDLRRAREAEVRVSLASDVGGGTSLSPFATMKAAYEVAQLKRYSIDPLESIWLATGAGAMALSLEDRIGRIAPGYDADLVVIDPCSTPLLANRVGRAESLKEVLFALIVMADDRAIEATYAAGVPVYRRTADSGACS